jgi:hypothetical protein
MRRDDSGRGETLYLLTLLACGAALIACVAAFDAAIDPFCMYHGPATNGTGRYKPAVYNRVRLYKAFEVRRLRPQVIILGSSRVHIGLSCSHPALMQLNEPCYNLAFDGATTKEMYAYLRHAQAIRPLRHVILGLDVYHASTAPSFTRPDFDPLVLRDGHAPAWWRLITGDLRILASLDAFRASVDALIAGKSTEPSWFAPDGQRLGEVFFHRKGEDFTRLGPRAYFDEIDRLEVGFQTADAAPPAGKVAMTTLPWAADPNQTSLAYVRRIVEFCGKRNIDLRIFFTPSHVHQLEIAAAAGAWPAIENGKRALVRMLAEESARHPGAPPVPLIDFSGYSSVTTEALPARDSRTEMSYYWDSSHFKEIVGDYVLDRLFGFAAVSRGIPADFGVRLTQDTIEPYLSRQRIAQATYRDRFPTEVAALRSLVLSKMHPVAARKNAEGLPRRVSRDGNIAGT